MGGRCCSLGAHAFYPMLTSGERLVVFTMALRLRRYECRPRMMCVSRSGPQSGIEY